MKNRLGLVLSLCFFALCSIANAIPIYQLFGTKDSVTGLSGDIPNNGTGGGGGNANANNDASNLFRLTSILPANLPTPMLAGALDLGSNVVGDGGLVGFDYAVLHYGSGKGGTPGGGVEFFALNGNSKYTFPDNGTGPNGNGGFSSLTLFKGDHSKTVPDGGSTVMLFGAALGLIAVARRKFRV
jgi:VPDSG-CTERM motif